MRELSKLGKQKANLPIQIPHYFLRLRAVSRRSWRPRANWPNLPRSTLTTSEQNHISFNRGHTLTYLPSRYNYKWGRTLQDAIATVLICAWLGGMGSDSKPGEVGRLLTLEEVGEVFGGKTDFIAPLESTNMAHDRQLLTTFSSSREPQGP